jgi:hypothetical protein
MQHGATKSHRTHTSKRFVRSCRVGERRSMTGSVEHEHDVAERVAQRLAAMRTARGSGE